LGDRSKVEAVRAWIREQETQSFKAFGGATGETWPSALSAVPTAISRKVNRSWGKMQDGRSVMIGDCCINVCAETVAEHRAGR